MKYEVHFGEDIRNLCVWECEAESLNEAKTKFRKKFGFNNIKVQRVRLVK